MLKLPSIAPIIVMLAGLTYAEVMASNTSDKARELAIKLDQRDQGFQSSHATMSMVIKNRNGDSTTRKLEVNILERPYIGNLSLMVFDFPADIRGTALLTHPKQESSDDQWLFLPSINRVKRISSRNKSGAFVSSEFAFEDLSDTLVDDFTYSLLGQQSCTLSLISGGQSSTKDIVCEKLERIPVDKNSGYSKQHLLLDKEHLRVIEIEYFDIRGKRLKTLTTQQFMLFEDKYWRPLTVNMHNWQTGKSTELSYDSLEFGVKLAESDFSKARLGR